MSGLASSRLQVGQQVEAGEEWMGAGEASADAHRCSAAAATAPLPAAQAAVETLPRRHSLVGAQLQGRQLAEHDIVQLLGHLRYRMRRRQYSNRICPWFWGRQYSTAFNGFVVRVAWPWGWTAGWGGHAGWTAA